MSHGCAEVVLLFKCLKACVMEDSMKERTWPETLRLQGRGGIDVGRNSNKEDLTSLVIRGSPGSGEPQRSSLLGDRTVRQA